MTEYASGGSVIDSLATSTNGTAFVPTPGRPVIVTITGTWVGTVKVQKSRDGGTTRTGTCRRRTLCLRRAAQMPMRCASSSRW